MIDIMMINIPWEFIESKKIIHQENTHNRRNDEDH
jgi:hypothetical protein